MNINIIKKKINPIDEIIILKTAEQAMLLYKNKKQILNFMNDKLENYQYTHNDKWSKILCSVQGREIDNVYGAFDEYIYFEINHNYFFCNKIA